MSRFRRFLRWWRSWWRRPVTPPVVPGWAKFGNDHKIYDGRIIASDFDKSGYYTDLNPNNHDLTVIAKAIKYRGEWQFDHYVDFGPGPARAETPTEIDGELFACRYENPNNMGSAMYMWGRAEPVLKPTPNRYDSDMVYSPSAIWHNGCWLMVYRGSNYHGSDPRYLTDAKILMAESRDLLSWGKFGPITFNHIPDWAKLGQAEPSILADGKGGFILLFMGMRGEERCLGVAITDDPLGTWEVNPDPLLKVKLPEKHLAPSGEIIGDKLIVYYNREDYKVWQCECELPVKKGGG